MKMKLKGLYPATVTPFNEDFTIDFDDLEKHLRKVASVPKVSGIVVNGHAGEIVVLNSDERAEIVAVARKVCSPDQLLVSGIDATTPEEAVREGIMAKQAGADALLVLPPFDRRPYRHLSPYTEPVFRYFAALNDGVGLPLVIFQYSDSSGCAYPIKTLLKLAELDNVVAIKAAVGTVTRYSDVWEALNGKISILPACDAPPFLGMLLRNADGALVGISVIGTEYWVELVDCAIQGNAEKAKEIFNKVCIPVMSSVFDNMEFTDTTIFAGNTKEALVQMGLMKSSRVRPPAIEITPERCARINKNLKLAELI